MASEGATASSFSHQLDISQKGDIGGTEITRSEQFMSKSLIIPKTVGEGKDEETENSPPICKPKLKKLKMPQYEHLGLSKWPWSPTSLTSSPLIDSVSDEEFLLSLNRHIPSSPPAWRGTTPRRGSSGLAATILARANAGKPLRMSSSTSHLPGTNCNASGTKCTPARATMGRSREGSDCESVGSSESIQDLTNSKIHQGHAGVGVHRQFSTGPVIYPIRRSKGGKNKTSSLVSVSSSSPINGPILAAQILNRQVSSYVRSQSVLIRRSFSNQILDEDFNMASKNCSPDSSESESNPMAKHLHIENVISKHTLKGNLSRFQCALDKAFNQINKGLEESIIERCQIVTNIMDKVWRMTKIGHDLGFGLCDYIRKNSYLDDLVKFTLNCGNKKSIHLATVHTLSEILTEPNVSYLSTIIENPVFEELVEKLKLIKPQDDEAYISITIFSSLFSHSTQTCLRLIQLSILDYILDSCKRASASLITLQCVSLALTNLALYSDTECRRLMILKNVPDWLFFLANSQDTLTRYYACLCASILVCYVDIETTVVKSGVLDLVEQILSTYQPVDIVRINLKNIQQRPKDWLGKLVGMLGSRKKESRSMATFEMAVEALVKKDEERLEIFHEIGAVDGLKQVAALPEDLAPKFASLALEIIGAEIPRKLTRQVPLWTVEDVQYWVSQIGFEEYSQSFADQKVDGDLLLLIRDCDLERDIGMHSSLLRRRFLRELQALKISADYSSIDNTQLDTFLSGIDHRFSMYTYQLLEMGVDRSMLASVTEDMLQNGCGIGNRVHRMKILKAAENCNHMDDMEISLISKRIDIFISYRRSTGGQLASLIKVLLQLRGYKIFIDVDRLYAGKFDQSLLKNIQGAKHFILVLSQNAFDRCMDDYNCEDWLHRELQCAMHCKKNIIPVFDPQFEWPDESRLPGDIRQVTAFNGVRWVHEYQEACVDKLVRFIECELNLNREFCPPATCSLCNDSTSSVSMDSQNESEPYKNIPCHNQSSS